MKGIEVGIPCTEIEFVVIHQRTSEDIVLQLVERPLESACLEVKSEHTTIATTNIRYSLMDSSCTHDRLVGGKSP